MFGAASSSVAAHKLQGEESVRCPCCHGAAELQHEYLAYVGDLHLQPGLSPGLSMELWLSDSVRAPGA